ncbi:MAG: hypothetical protein QM776_00265 [Rhodocyclaceae bacterium]
MNSRSRLLLFSTAALVGVLIANSEPWIHLLSDQVTRILLPFLSHASTQSLTSLLLLIVATSPVGWLARADGFICGVLTGGAVIATFFVSWFWIDAPRPELNYSFLNALNDIVYILVAAVACSLWGRAATKARSA